MKKIIVLGGGLIGCTIAKDLAKDKNYEVTLADGSQKALDSLAKESSIKVLKADLSNPEIVKNVVKDFDIVVGAILRTIAYQMIKAVIEAGKDICDISSGPGDRLALDGLAKSKGVTVVYDFGVAPGMSNALVGYGASLLDEPESGIIYVGGMPVIREWPYEYKAAWSPVGVIAEYVEPAIQLRNGKIEIKPALSEVELLDFPGIGTLEAFNTDGAGSLNVTRVVPTAIEKTLRYPGHAEKIRMLRETGFLSDKEIEVAGVKIKPVDLAAKLLFPIWELKPGENELTVMKVTVDGKKDGKRVRHVFDMCDYYDFKENNSSMARTTGFTCSIMTRLIAEGEFVYKGVCPPEYVGQNHAIMKKLFEELSKKGIDYKHTVEQLD